MSNRMLAGMILTVALPALAVLAGCGPSVDSDPNSPEFAALCSGAYGHYYVEGGKGPEYQAYTKRQFYWRDRYYKLAGMSTDAARKLIKIGYDLAYEHRGETTAEQNKAMKTIIDACARNET